MKKLAYIMIDYNDDGYKAVVVVRPDEKFENGRRFETGDPAADFKEAMDYASTFGDAVLTSSSVGDFVFDVPGWAFDEDDMLVRDGSLH